jgi:hypothetical protein
MEMEEIIKCCTFIIERIEKEMYIMDSDFYTTSKLNSGKYKDLLFYQFKRILLRESDPILQEEYLLIVKRLISAFKDLKTFQKVQFNLESKNDINYTKFYKEIFEIINYITNLFPVEEYKYDLKTIYPSYITYRRLQQLLPVELNNNKKEKEKEMPIQPKEIMEMFRCFLLVIFARSFLFIYYNINEFIQVFLSGEFRHDKYIGLIAQQKLDLLYDIVHKPNINKIFSNYWYEMQFQDKDLYRYKYNNNMKDILNFGLFLKEINDNFIIFNESYNIKYCLLYFFLLFNYEGFNFLENSFNKSNYQSFLLFFINEVISEEMFNDDNPKKLNELLTNELFNFIHGKNFCSFYPTIYLEKFFVDVFIKKVNNDRDMNFPKDPWNYYTNRIKKYNNIKIIVESLSINWPEKNKLLDLIKEKIKSNINHIKYN